MADRIHLMLCGERQIGKSTCIRRVIEELRPGISGFVTKSLAQDEDGFHNIFIHPATQPEEERRHERDNMIGRCNSFTRSINTEVFDTVGAELLRSHSGGLIIMDELGFMEKDAHVFQKTVMDCLDGDAPVLGAIKPVVWSDFLNTIRCHDKVEVVPIYERTREEVYEYVLRRVSEILGRKV